MKLNAIDKNQTELILEGKIIFFSYNTPVACMIGGQYFRTSKKFSNTTSKHITKWLSGNDAEQKEQEFFETLVK